MAMRISIVAGPSGAPAPAAVVDFAPAFALDALDGSMLAEAARRAAATPLPPAATSGGAATPTAAGHSAAPLPTPVHSSPLACIAMRYPLLAAAGAFTTGDGAPIDEAALAASVVAAQFDYEQSA